MMRAFFAFGEAGTPVKKVKPLPDRVKGHRRSVSSGSTIRSWEHRRTISSGSNASTGSAGSAGSVEETMSARRRARASVPSFGSPTALSNPSSGSPLIGRRRARSFGRYDDTNAVDAGFASILSDKLDTGQITEDEYDHMMKIAAAGSRILEPKGEDVDADLLSAEDGMVEIRLSPSPVRRGLDNDPIVKLHSITPDDSTAATELANPKVGGAS